MDNQFPRRPDGSASMVYLRLSGELDLAGVGQTRQKLRAAVAGTGDGGCLLLDLTDVTFMDGAGLAVLLRAAQDASRRQIEIQLTGEQGAVARLLDLTQARRTLLKISGRKTTTPPW